MEGISAYWLYPLIALAGAAWLITANIIMSLVIDQFGMFGMDQHPLSLWRMLGAALMVAGVALITKF